MDPIPQAHFSPLTADDPAWEDILWREGEAWISTFNLFHEWTHDYIDGGPNFRAMLTGDLVQWHEAITEMCRHAILTDCDKDGEFLAELLCRSMAMQDQIVQELKRRQDRRSLPAASRPLLDKTLIEQVRQVADIVQVFEVRGVPLTQMGREWKGLCPFHRDKNPSMSVNPGKGVFMCYACKAHGDVFTVVMRLDGLHFHDAVGQLGKEFGVSVPEWDSDRRAREIIHAAPA